MSKEPGQRKKAAHLRIDNEFSSEIGEFTYGEIPEIAVKPVPGHPDLIVAITTIGINCGADSSLYLFKKHSRTWWDLLSWKTSPKWDLILAQEANDYKDVGGAQGDFRYAFSSPSFAGQFFILTTSTSPWCTSAWNSLHYRVSRPGRTAYQPLVLLDREETIYLDKERIITMLPKGFKLEFQTRQNLDVDALIRDHTANYEVQGDRVLRVPPFDFPARGLPGRMVQYAVGGGVEMDRRSLDRPS